MRKLFLASQLHHVAQSIGSKLNITLHTPIAFINTCLTDKVHTDQELVWHYKNIDSLKQLGFEPRLYDIAGKSEDEIKVDLSKYEYMYVEGGNTFHLLKESQKNNFGSFVKGQIKAGMIYLSTSAGSVIAGLDTTSNGRPGKTAQDYGVSDTSGYKLVNCNILPHWGDPKKREMYANFKFPQSYKEDFPYIFLTDNQYLEVIDNKYKIVDITKK